MVCEIRYYNGVLELMWGSVVRIIPSQPGDDERALNGLRCLIILVSCT